MCKPNSMYFCRKFYVCMCLRRPHAGRHSLGHFINGGCHSCRLDRHQIITVHCTTQYMTVHCTTQYMTVHCTTQYMTVHCTTQYMTVHCTTQYMTVHCTTQYMTVHCTTQYMTVHCTTQYMTVHCTTQYMTVHCTTQYMTWLTIQCMWTSPTTTHSNGSGARVHVILLVPVQLG